MSGTSRSSEGLDPRRRRILFRAWHRGTREMDLILGTFADAHVADLTEPDLAEFERLIEIPDRDIYAWLTGAEATPAGQDGPLFVRLKSAHSRIKPLHA